MATKAPLARYSDSGKIEEMRVGDTIPPAVQSRSFAFFAGA
jgi:hypothetical protein